MARVTRIISGGQTGADQGALAAARQLGLSAGGWMPHGFATETGPRPDFLALYGMREHPQPGPAPRTEANVRESDATLIVGDTDLGGTRDTKEFCAAHKKTCFVLPWSPGEPVPRDALPYFRHWLDAHAIHMLNVGGNRESEAPGIHDVVFTFLLAALAG